MHKITTVKLWGTELRWGNGTSATCPATCTVNPALVNWSIALISIHEQPLNLQDGQEKVSH